MSVKIVDASKRKECRDSDYVRVSTCSDPLDDTVTLATIQRFVAKQRFDEPTREVRVKTLVQNQPMSSDDALGLATCYAKRKHVPVIYTDQTD